MLHTVEPSRGLDMHAGFLNVAQLEKTTPEQKGSAWVKLVLAIALSKLLWQLTTTFATFVLPCGLWSLPASNDSKHPQDRRSRRRVMERKVLMIATRRTPAERRFETRFEANKHRRIALTCLVLQPYCGLASSFARLPDNTQVKSSVLGVLEKDDEKESADDGLKEDKPKSSSISRLIKNLLQAFHGELCTSIDIDLYISCLYSLCMKPLHNPKNWTFRSRRILDK